jgi:hypothetical protein
VSGPTVEVEGLARLQSTLRRAELDLGDLKDANARAGAMVAQWAAVRAPRRTGRLGMSVRSARQAKAAVIVAGSASVPYAGPIHWGWPARHITAQPWISDAAVETQPSWLPVYAGDIQRVLDTVRGV